MEQFMKNTAGKTSYRGRAVLANAGMMLRFITGCIFFIAVLGSLSMAQETTSQISIPQALSPADKGKVIYVQDFDADLAGFKQDKGGITGKGMILPATPAGFPKLFRRSSDPVVAAQKLIDLMSTSLVTELEKAGFTVVRLSWTDELPKQGLLVRGVFTEMNEGNQMRRALIGFGAGKAKMELFVTVADASQPLVSIYDVVTEKTNGKMPGAAVTVNPYVVPAKFVLTKNSPEKAVKKAAKQIASEITKQLNGETEIAMN
jgi:hypothetical protein